MISFLIVINFVVVVIFEDADIELDGNLGREFSPPVEPDLELPRTRTFFPETWQFLVIQTELVKSMYYS